MPTPITRHVLSHTRGHPGQPFDLFWQAFGQLVRSEWYRLRLHAYAPSILGYTGYRNWCDAWDEIQANAYVAAVLRPAPQLLAALRREPSDVSIDALVRVNVRRHFQACRAQADPIGASVYRRVCFTLRRLVSDGALVAVSPAGRSFCKDTVVSFTLFPACLTTAAEMETLLPALPDWNRLCVLLACTRGIRGLSARLRKLIQALGQAGCRRFQVAALVKPMQQAARRTARELMRSRVGTPVGARPGKALANELSSPGDDVRDCCGAADFEERCQRVQRWIESSSRDDARRNRLRVFQTCLPTIRQGYWPSVREVVTQLCQVGDPIARGSVADHLRALKEFWEAETRNPDYLGRAPVRCVKARVLR